MHGWASKHLRQTAVEHMRIRCTLVYSLRTYGKAVLALYTVFCSVLLGNLLIAIITNRYKPEKVREQAALNMAESKWGPMCCW